MLSPTRTLAALTLMTWLAACGAQSAAPAPTAVPAAPTVAPSAPAPTAAPSSAAGFPLTITDAAGQEFTFDAPPKIGCWWAGCTEMLGDLGLVAHAGSYTDEQATSAFFYPAGVPQQRVADTQNPEHWAAAEVDIILFRQAADRGA